MTSRNHAASRCLAALAVAIVFVSGCSSARQPDQSRIGHDGHAKYVFLFIGDGMGPAQVNATEIYRAAVRQAGDEAPVPAVDLLVMSRLPVHGEATTFSANSQTTDSAASGTALATGNKTNNGMISVAPDEAPLATVAERARARGMKVGLITDVPANHATPAVFYAHQQGRGQSHDISMQIPTGCADFLAGSSLPGGDGLDTEAIAAAQAAGFRYVTSRDELEACGAGDRVLSITPEMTFVTDRQPGAVSLTDLLAKAVEVLDDPDGFFIMVEGGRIDWTGHANDARATFDEVQAFDDAVAVAVDFYRRHPAETLIVVTADHETGGMALGTNGGATATGMADLARQTMTYQRFDRLYFQPVKEAGNWTGVADDVPEALKQQVAEVLGLAWADLTPKQSALLELAYDQSMGGAPPGEGLYGKREAFPVALGQVLSQRAGITWTTFGHSPLNVPVRAAGAGSYRFGGVIDNTQIPRRMAEVMGLEPLQN